MRKVDIDGIDKLHAKADPEWSQLDLWGALRHVERHVYPECYRISDENDKFSGFDIPSKNDAELICLLHKLWPDIARELRAGRSLRAAVDSNEFDAAVDAYDATTGRDRLRTVSR